MLRSGLHTESRKDMGLGEAKTHYANLVEGCEVHERTWRQKKKRRTAGAWVAAAEPRVEAAEPRVESAEARVERAHAAGGERAAAAAVDRDYTAWLEAEGPRVEAAELRGWTLRARVERAHSPHAAVAAGRAEAARKRRAERKRQSTGTSTPCRRSSATSRATPLRCARNARNAARLSEAAAGSLNAQAMVF